MDESTQAKVCTKCGVKKPLDQYHRRTRSPDGRFNVCKRCRNAALAIKYAATVTPERRSEGADRARRRRAQMTPEQREAAKAKNREYMRKRYQAQRDELLAKRAAAKAADPERFREYARAFREANPEKLRAWARQYRENYPERRAEHHQRRRARLLGTRAGKVDVESLWTGACGICGDPLDGSLSHPHPLSKSLDHIVPLARGGTHTQDNLQWAHLVCNFRKGASTPS